MTASILAFSERGHALGEGLCRYFRVSGDKADLARCGPGGLSPWTREHFGRDCLVFIGSCGIAVRAVAPLLQSKMSDPAVIVIDEGGGYVIPLLSGHMGGANELALRLARHLGAAAVITTATDVNGVFAVDTWARRQGLRVANPERIKSVSARLLAGGSIRIQSEFPIAGRPPEGVSLCDCDADVLITYHAGRAEDSEALRLIPPSVTLGVGCRKDTRAQDIEQAFERLLAESRCHPLAVAGVCSIDLKAREPGILRFCESRGLSYRTFSAEALMALPGEYTTSDFVRGVTGADNVCERSAVLGSGAGGRLLAAKSAGGGVTMALAIAPYPLTFDEEDSI